MSPSNQLLVAIPTVAKVTAPKNNIMDTVDGANWFNSDEYSAMTSSDLKTLFIVGIITF